MGMFSQLLFIRLRAAEKALQAGQLDEAYRLATAPDLRTHRRAAAVLASLTQRFLERARGHYRAERFAEALADLDRAETGGVRIEEIEELRSQVHVVAAEQQRKEWSRRHRLDDARKRIEKGSLAAGREVLEQASQHDYDAQNLRKDMDRRSAEIDGLLCEAERFMQHSRWSAAAEYVCRGRSLDGHHPGVLRLESKLCTAVLQNARQSIEQGKLSRADHELECLGSLGEALPAKRELRELLSLARQAARCLQACDYTEAQCHVMSLDRRLPGTDWIRQALEQLQRISQLSAELRAGPLGEAQNLPVVSPPFHAEPQASLTETVALTNRPVATATLPARLLLLVDGGGSYLILRGPQASIGRAAAEILADVPIFSDIAERQANVTRVDDDYFVFSAREIEVAGKPTKHQLLQHGDRIVLGRRAKLTFGLPSRKSPTAVLDLSDTTKMPHDVRRVILFHQHATIGQGPTAHVPCRHVGASLVLFERKGSLWVRARNDGHVDPKVCPVRLGEPMNVAGASFVINPWGTAAPGRHGNA